MPTLQNPACTRKSQFGNSVACQIFYKNHMTGHKSNGMGMNATVFLKTEQLSSVKYLISVDTFLFL